MCPGDAEPEPEPESDRGGAAQTVTDPTARCIRCGYALRGLDSSGACPECGTPVERSISEDLIVHADPQWRKGLMMGLTLLGLGPLITLVAILVAIGAMISSGLIARWLLLFGGAVWLVALGGLLMAAVGGFLATAPELRDADRVRADDPRVIARWGLPAAVGLLVAVTAVTAAGGLGGLPAVQVIGIVVQAAAVGLAGMALAALHRRFGEIARRIPDVRLSERCDRGVRWYRRATVFLVVLLLAAATRTATTGVTGLSPLNAALDLLVGLGGCVALVLMILGLVRTIGIFDLALSVRRAIRDAVAAAEAEAAVAAIAEIAAAERTAMTDPAP
jgi:hypothetical protein